MDISTILIFILILFVVVIGHELGHFIVARWCGVKVEEFGFGLPPKLFGYKPKKSNTEYTFNLLPLGGFVRLFGEEGEFKDNPQSFASKTKLQKIAILVAGVTMNLIIAIIVFTIVGMMGSVTLIEDTDIGKVKDPAIYVVDVAKESPAGEKEIMLGDKIISINGTVISNNSDLLNIINDNKGKEIDLVLERQGESLSKTLLARENPPEGQGSIGIGFSLGGLLQLNFWDAFISSLTRIYFIFYMTFYTLWQLFIGIFTETQLPAGASFTGPIGIVKEVGNAQAMGISYLLMITGMISTSLAFFNILPIPALDGGRILFILIEMIKKSPINKDLETKFHLTSYLLLIGLMLFITLRDIINLF